MPNAPRPGTVVASLAELCDGGAAFWSRGEGKDAFRLIILRSGEAAFGYVNRCAHFGVPLAETTRQLILTPHESIACNVHYARYGWRDGTCLRGDCDGEGLLTVPLRIEGGDVLVAR